MRSFKSLLAFILLAVLVFAFPGSVEASKFRPYTSLTGATADSLDSETGMAPGDPAFVVTAAGIFSPYVCKASSSTANGTTIIQPALITNTYRWHICGFAGDGAGLTNVNAALLGGHAASYFQPAGSYLLPTGDASRLSGITASQVGLGNVLNVIQMPLSYLNDSDDTLSGSGLKVPTDAMVAAYVAAYVADHGGSGGGGATYFTDLLDGSIITPTNNQALLYNSSSGKWTNTTLGTGAFATISGYVPTARTVNGYALSSNISLSYGDVGAAASSHNHSAAAITSGILGMTYGGLGASLSDPGYNGFLFWDDADNANQFIHLGTGLSYDHETHTISSSAAAGSTTFDLIGAGTNTSGATMTVGNTSSLNFTGTGTINASSLNGHADTYFATSAHTHSTYLTVANNLSDLNSASTARTNLGLGSMATQASNNVSITGGTISASSISGTSVSGAWAGSIITGTYGGTGVNNGSYTITLGGNVTTAGAFTTSGAYGVTLTATALTSVTLPTSGTLATLAGSESLTNKKLGSLTTNGFVKTSGSDGTLSVDTNTYLTTTGSSSGLSGYPSGAQPVDATLTAFAGLTITAGSIPYGTGTDAFAVLAAGTQYKMLQMGASAPGWSAYTFPASIATGDLLYGSGTNAISALGAGSSGQLLRQGASTAAWSTFTIPATVAAGSVLVANTANTVTALTSTSGTYYLKNADGTISWAAAPGGTPAGTTYDIQLNSSGSFAADTGVFYYDTSTHTLHIGSGGIATPQAATASSIYGWEASGNGTNKHTINFASSMAADFAWTLPSANPGASSLATIGTDGAWSYTAVSTFLTSGGALGTPSGGTLTNCSGLPISGLTASTSTALGVGSIELGHASDTTLARVSAGVASIEGATIATLTANNAFTGANTIGDTSSNNLQKIILRKPSSLSDHDWQGISELGTAGENLSRGNIVYKKYNSSAWKWYKYDANGTDKLIMPEGIATADITSGNDGVILTEGMMRDDTWNLTASADAAVAVYGSVTPGGVSLTAPSSTTEEVVIVGKLAYANTIRTRFGYASVEVK